MFQKALCFALLLFFTTSWMAVGARACAPVSSDNLGDDEHRIFELVNRERDRMRLGELQWDEELADLARSYSQQMADQHFFSHYDRSGETVVQRAEQRRIKGWERIGENLFETRGIDDLSAFAVRGWMKSPTHRSNILDNGWTATGVGIAVARDGRVYITEVFTQDYR
jgi:uncharacterized protein YkwD